MSKEERQGLGSSLEPHPKDGHIRVPNEIVDKLAQLQASGAEWQIIFKTWSQPPKYIPLQYPCMICGHCMIIKALGH